MARALKVSWSPMPRELELQQLVLEQVYRSWDGTPYRARKQDRGPQGGVDCVRFAAGVLDDCRGRKTPVATLPDDAALHNREAAIVAMFTLRQALEPNEMLRWGGGPAEVQPGDVVVTGPAGGGPGHAMLVGCAHGELWESSNVGVRRVGLSALEREGTAIFYVFRCLDRASWRSA